MDYFVLAIIGLLAGLLGGLLGIGGSVLMIPGMTIVLGPDQQLYQGAAMIVNFFVAFPAATQHRRADATLVPVVRVMVPAAVVSVLAGVWLSSGSWFRGTNEVYLSRLFGGFVLYAAGYNVYRLFSRRTLPDITLEHSKNLSRPRIAGAVGVPMGLAAGLLGIGGGALAVPLQQVFLRMPVRRAIANSATAIVFLSVVGAIYKNYRNVEAGIPLVESLRLAGVLIPTAVVGGLTGGRLAHVLPRRALRVAVIALMCYAGIEMISRPARDTESPGGSAESYPAAVAPDISVSQNAASPSEAPDVRAGIGRCATLARNDR
jgi:uncharacterized membrane protein YfcA